MKVFLTGGSGYVGRNLIKYLRAKSISINALARSDEAEKTVTDAGAQVIRGDLDNNEALIQGMQGCDIVIHAAAFVGQHGTWQQHYNTTVLGTKHVLEAASQVESVKRFVHIGSEAALCTLQPLVNIDETYPLPDNPKCLYPRAKNLSERLVREFNETQNKLQTVVVRPRFIWGGDDTVLLPVFKQSIESGEFKWANGGVHKTSMSHIKNVCEGVYLAATKEKVGDVYFILDGEPVQFKKVITDMMATQGIDTSKIGNLPSWVLWSVAWTMENVVSWFATSNIERFGVWVLTSDCILSDAKARHELGYKPVITYEEGMEELTEQAKK
jgi:nucleoside-diphosphate-sugar epimerase